METQTQQCKKEDLMTLSEWMEAEENKEVEGQQRVKQDQLQEVSLGDEEDEKKVKVSVKLEEWFKEQLIQLLEEYKDVFACSYSNMEGIDPKFY